MFRHQTVCNARDCAATLNDIVTNLDEGVRITERPSIIRLEHNDDLLITYYEDRPAFVEATESGAPCEITDAARDMPVTSAEVTITVTQESGTPAPDNFLAFTSFTELSLTHEDGDGSEETFAFTFPDEAGNVYGGTLDVISGVLTVTHMFVEFDGTETWSKSVGEDDDHNTFYMAINTEAAILDTSETPKYSLLENAFITTANTTQGGRVYNGANWTRFACRFTGYTDLTRDEFAEFVADLKEAGTPLQTVFKLSDPVEYQLDPVAMQTVRGANTFTSSLESTVAVGYWADPLLTE